MSERKEITKIIERLELLEEKFGIAISGLYATCEHRPNFSPPIYQIAINFDLASLSGGKLKRNFKVLASAYNSSGQLLGTTPTYIDAGDFMGFGSFSDILYLDQAPKKIRLSPAA